MGTHELAFEVADPPVSLALPPGSSDDLHAEFEAVHGRAQDDGDLEGGAAALLALSGRVAASQASAPASIASVLSRCALQQLAARLLRGAGERGRALALLRPVVDELTDVVERSGGSSDALALWLSARFELAWFELESLPSGVARLGDAGAAMETAVAAMRDGRLDERAGFGLVAQWIDHFDRPGREGGAFKLRADLVSVAEERFGPLAFTTLALRHLEADLLETHGQLEKAWKLFERLTRDVERAGETGGLLALQVRSGHAFLAGRRGAPKRAIRLYRELLGDLEAGRFDGDSTGPFDIHAPMPGTAYQAPISLVRMNLAVWLVDQGELAEAERMLRAVVDTAAATVLAPGEPVDSAAAALQDAQRALGMTLRDLGRHDESVPVLRALLAGRLSVATPDDAQVDEARSLLMAALLRTGDHEGARTVGEALLGARSHRLGRTNPSTVLAAVQLAAAEHALGSPDAHEPLERFARELQQTVGEPDERTLHARILLQAALARDEHELAPLLAEDNLSACLRHLGSRHHLTADARRAAGA